MSRFSRLSRPRARGLVLLVALVSAGAVTGAAEAAPAPLAVVIVAPADAATQVPTSTNSRANALTGTPVSATFSVPMDPATLVSSVAEPVRTFTLADATGTDVPGVVTLDATGTVATLTPLASRLDTGARYVATISTAATDTAGAALAEVVTWDFTTTPVIRTAQERVNLGTAGTFAILSKSGVTSVYASTINGNVGSSPITGAAIGLTCAEVHTGIIYSVNAAGPACKTTNATYLTTAVGDMQTAYADAAGRTVPDQLNLGAGEIGGLTLEPGLYRWTTGVSISTDVTLAGGPNDVWILQVAGNIKMASAKNVTLIGGAQAKNVYWQSAGSTAIGTTAHFEGTILSKTLIAMKTGSSINGRLLAQTAVTLQKSTVTLPTS